MFLLDEIDKNNILTVSPDTLLIEVINLMGKFNQNADRDKCIFVMENTHLLGIFTFAHAVELFASKINLEQVKIAELITQPPPALGRNFDFMTALSLMQQHNTHHLPILDDDRQILQIVSLESIVKDEIEQQVVKRTEELAKANKLLQRGICDRIATEAQLLQTTSQLQELFLAFPDIYFRLKNDGTILSCHTGDTSNLYLPAETFLGKRIQDVLPADVGCQFQQAIFELFETNSLIAIEYSLQLSIGKKSFEARLLPSIQYQIVVIVRDITERKQAQDALEKAKNELEVRVEERTRELKNTNERLLQEIIEKQRIEQALRYKVEFEKLITTISTHFINLATKEIDQGINQALQVIGEFVDVDRSYIFLFNDNGIKMDNTHQWYTPNVQGLIDHKPENLVEIFPWILEKLNRFEITHITSSNELFNQNFQSVIILPIVCSGVLIGYLGFESIKKVIEWTEDSIVLLKMVVEILGNALERKRVEQALKITEERYTRAINAGNVGIWEWNIQTDEIYIDPNLKSMLGYVENKNYAKFSDWLSLVHIDDIELVKAEINSYLEGLIPKYEIEHRMLCRDGNYLWFLARGTALKDENNHLCFIAGSNTDITARKQAEDKLKASLREKDVLIKEIHHRVKNNLQVISSLLRLQAAYIKDEQALDVFQDSQNRVRAMAMIHENLYHSHDLAKINFSEYLQNLTNNLIRSYRLNQNIKIKLNLEKVFLRIDTAIPCGLIINELVSNSMKHAFVEQNIGEIYIEFSTLEPGKYSLNVSDNGKGFAKDIESCKNHSLGLQLVWNLVEQLEGTIAFKNKLGTIFNITFVEQN